jgi:thiol-disulfide isomerase/thioredoxin
MAPDFDLAGFDGSRVRLSRYRGKAVLLNFWATWCEPCRVEMPSLIRLERKYRARGLQIVGVAIDSGDLRSVAQFVKEIGVNYPIALGDDAVAAAYGGVSGLPTSFYIDRDGRIVDETIGLIRDGAIERRILGMLEPRSETLNRERRAVKGAP